MAFAAFLSYACGGCLSNEYVIPKTELVRLASLPPEQRGQSVHVVQRVGERRSEAIEVGQPLPPPPAEADDGWQGPPPDGYVESGPPVSVGVGVVVVPGPPLPGPPVHGGMRPPVGGRGPVTGPPVGGRAPVTGPAVGGRAPVPPGRAAPPARTPAGGRGGNVGGGNKDEVVALLIIFAVLATVGLVATEGVRYDGIVAMYPWQSVHLKGGSAPEREIPLAQLTPADAAASAEAVVMDDEGWGLWRLGRRPLDRQGFAWKMSVGLLHSPALAADALAGDIQLGYFVHPMVGILADWAPAGGSDANGNSFSRHHLGLEAQVFPLAVSRLHLGGFAHGGVVFANDTPGGTRRGAAFGGGAMLEVALTTRLAFTARFDYTSAKIAPDGQGWQGAESFVAGIAIY